jgi:DNA-binding NarL/FixJ family response regulator
MDQSETCRGAFCPIGDLRLRVILADASLHYMETVLTLIDLHEIVDLIGRAANFEETIQLVVNHQPDLVLLDLDMPSANLILPAIILSTTARVKVVGMSPVSSFSSYADDVLIAVNALVHKEDLGQEFLPIVEALYGWPGND